MDMAIYMKVRRRINRETGIVTLGGRCVSCSSTKNLQFDHIVPATKKSVISNMLAHGKERFLDELRKCQLLCVECHKEKTRKDRGWGLHGGYTMFQRKKCRCDICMESRRVKMREYRKKKRNILG